MQPAEQAFYRGSDRIIGGVCAGLAAGFRIDALWIRLAFVLLAFVQGVGLFIYIVLWLVMPERVEGAAPRSGFDAMAADMRRVTQEVRGQLGMGGGGTPLPETRTGQSLVLGLVLVLVGVTLLAANTGLVTWTVVLPAVVIIVGVVLLIRTIERRA